MMKLSKKVKANIEREAKRIKAIYEAPNPETDKVIAELREEAKNRPNNLTREEEIAWILRESKKSIRNHSKPLDSDFSSLIDDNFWDIV